MARQAGIEGKFKVNVVDLDIEELGKKGNIALRVDLETYEELVGPNWEPHQPTKVKKLFWLSTDYISQGANSGKTMLEVTREQLKSLLDYTGGLDVAEMKQSICGKQAVAVCEINTSGYTDVKFLNHIHGKITKSPQEDKLRHLKAAWGGSAPAPLALSPEELFAAAVASVNKPDDGMLA